MTSDTGKPEWWRENERLRDELDLPPYEPPRFSDGVPLHEVVDALEDEFDCTIRLVGNDTRYGDKWEVRIDGDPVEEIGRRRNEHANTVYELTAREFRRLVRARFDDG